MRILEPNVELIKIGNPDEKVAYCASICYNSPLKTGEKASNFCRALKTNEHLSMFRHQSVYYIIYYYDLNYKGNQFLRDWLKNPYVDIRYNNDDDKWYIATNENFLIDNPAFASMYSIYRVSEEDFNATELGHQMMRYTFCLTTQISTSRELSRTSPNNIAERSTRYLSIGEGDKKVEPSIVRPHWMSKEFADSYNNWEAKYPDLRYSKYIESCFKSFDAYDYLTSEGDDTYKIQMSKEDARGVLPLDTTTKVIYTYSVDEWKHIIDLRYHGTTGKPHPNAALIIGMVREELLKMGYEV